jgi:hypothetical protein
MATKSGVFPMKIALTAPQTSEKGVLWSRFSRPKGKFRVNKPPRLDGYFARASDSSPSTSTFADSSYLATATFMEPISLVAPDFVVACIKNSWSPGERPDESN